MSEYNDFPKDFLRRTMQNVESYQGQFEITNLINNCLGLIIIPNDHLIETLPDYTFDHSDNRFGIGRGNIEFERRQNFELKNIVRHVRNGLSHGLLEQRTYNKEIAGLRIYDRLNKHSPENFSIVLSVEALRDFAFSLANLFLGEA